MRRFVGTARGSRQGAAVWAALLVVFASLVFVGSASAAPVFGVAVFKDCGFSPINVGAPYSCEFEIDNTLQTSHLTITVKTLTDVVNTGSGAMTFTHAINSSFSGLILTGTASCDPTQCTLGSVRNFV